MSDPAISVLMPVYNSGEYLDLAIQSIHEQTYTDFEFVIVNDGSSDDCPQILDRWAKTDSRIQVVHQENAGLPKALNKGLESCRGKYIARMDGDDWCERDRFEKQLDFMENHPGCPAVGTQAFLVDPAGRTLGKGPVPEDHDGIDRLLLKGIGSALYHPAVLIRNSTLKDIGGYDESMELEDLDLFLKLSELGPIANLPDYLIYYRLHLKSTNHERRKIHAMHAMATVESAIKRRGAEGSIEVPQKPQLDDSLSGIYRDWANKAFLGGFRKTGWIHTFNILKDGFFRPSIAMKFLRTVIFGLRLASKS